ncbi:hypothetical protein SEPCBS57363_005996 [Sporothrix epigloea]|uniref:Uncharacterized protein n=1 Tax=Sporothrix epigloea TaxID=1892477 RepID=A0ABP0E113_9PEZI
MPPRVFNKVPTISQVVPGAYVNIVLKQDQPTGRTVHGIVQNVLTRGNHPRGIKVRLSDGRVGRVETMASVRSPDNPSTSALAATVFDTATRDTNDENPRLQIGLDAYIRTTPKQRKRRSNRELSQEAAATMTDTSVEATPATTAATEMTTCPVCGEFEGDEAAVTYHVATHFSG